MTTKEKVHCFEFVFFQMCFSKNSPCFVQLHYKLFGGKGWVLDNLHVAGRLLITLGDLILIFVVRVLVSSGEE